MRSSWCPRWKNPSCFLQLCGATKLVCVQPWTALVLFLCCNAFWIFLFYLFVSLLIMNTGLVCQHASPHFSVAFSRVLTNHLEKNSVHAMVSLNLLTLLGYHDASIVSIQHTLCVFVLIYVALPTAENTLDGILTRKNMSQPFVPTQFACWPTVATNQMSCYKNRALACWKRGLKAQPCRPSFFTSWLQVLCSARCSLTQMSSPWNRILRMMKVMTATNRILRMMTRGRFVELQSSAPLPWLHRALNLINVSFPAATRWACCSRSCGLDCSRGCRSSVFT